MTVPRSGPQVKYELLEENTRTAVKSSHLWSAVLFVILVICSSVIAVYLTWQHMLNSTKEKDNMDFLMFGPKKSYAAGYERSSRHRGQAYSEAILRMQNSPNLTLPQLSARVTPHAEPAQYKLVCYYSLPPSKHAFHPLTPDKLDPQLCTHINIAFATVDNGTINPSVDTDIKDYTAIVALKKKNPELKVMLSVEWFTSTGEFAWIVSSAENRTRFVNNAVEFLDQHGLDGLDVDWEFPSWPTVFQNQTSCLRFVNNAVEFLDQHGLDGLDVDWEFPSWPTVVQNQTSCFMELLRLLSERFHSRDPPLILSVAAGAPKPIIDQSYNITAMARYVDFVNVMAYDYHMYQSYLPLTGANAPLYERAAEQGYFTTLNTNWTAAYWRYKGLPVDKLIIGIPTYGHSYTLVNQANHGWEAPSSGVGSVGTDGFVAYYDVCSFMTQPGAKSVFDFESKVPYAYRSKEWISFDNEQSVAYKAEFAKAQGFGGVMMFSLNTDDSEAVCDGRSRFPLTRRARDVLLDDQL